MLKLAICLAEKYADVAKLADALDLGSSVFDVGVQVLSSAPMTYLFESNWTDKQKINQKINLVDFLLSKDKISSKKGWYESMKIINQEIQFEECLII